MQNSYIISTRKSPLALWQAKKTQELLLKHNIQTELQTVVTTGDKMQKSALASLSLNDKNLPPHLATGKGLFIKEVQELLLNNEAHIAVHSMKDLPTEQTSGLVIGAVLTRASPNDVLILSPELKQEMNQFNLSFEKSSFSEIKKCLLQCKSFQIKPIGTTSLRRQYLMRKIFTSQLNLVTLRGNVDSRLKKVQNNEFSAILLAQAGLERLNLFSTQNMISLPTKEFVPAAAQGVVAIECSHDNLKLLDNLQKINCPETCQAAVVERLILDYFDGGCHSTVGIFFDNINKIDIIYGQSNIQKDFTIVLSEKCIKELNKVTKKSKNYSEMYETLMDSFVLNEIKMHLDKEGFLH